MYGAGIGNTSTGTVDDSGMYGAGIGNTSTGTVDDSGMYGAGIGNTSTGTVEYSGMYGAGIGDTSTGTVEYSGVHGAGIGNTSTGTVEYSGVYGAGIGNTSTGTVEYSGMYGAGIRNTRSMDGIDVAADSVMSDVKSTTSSNELRASSIRDKNTVVVLGLPNFVSVELLYNCFNSQCRGVVKAYRIPNKSGCGEVVFSGKEEMEECLQKMHKTTLCAIFGEGNGWLLVQAKYGKRKSPCNPQEQQPAEKGTGQAYPSEKEKGNQPPQEKEKGDQLPAKKEVKHQPEKGKVKQSQPQKEKGKQPPSEKGKGKQLPTQKEKRNQSAPKKEKGKEPPPQKEKGKHSSPKEEKGKPPQKEKQPRTQKEKGRQPPTEKGKGNQQSLQKVKGKPSQKVKGSASQLRENEQPPPLMGQLVLPPEREKCYKQQPSQNLNVIRIRTAPQCTTEAELTKFITEACEGIEVLRIHEENSSYFVELKCEEPLETVRAKLNKETFNERKLRVSIPGGVLTQLQDQRPYVVIGDVRKKVKVKDIKSVFEESCQGVVEVERVDGNYMRVYFETVGLAVEAQKLMDGVSSLKRFTNNCKVVLGAWASQEAKVKYELPNYLAALQEKRVQLLEENTKKLRNIISVVNELSKSKKKYSVPEFQIETERLKTYNEKATELQEQRKEFEKKYDELVSLISSEVEVNPSAVTQVIEKYRKRFSRELMKFEASLPIYAKRRKIVETIRANQVTVLIGETGSGKSTQLAQYLADELQQEKRIVVTQPRKIAALSLAKRVAEEYCCDRVGQEVGYHVGLRQKVSAKTKIKFVTDRILLNEILKDRESVGNYSCIVIDEAHERSIYTDLLLAMIKQNLPRYPDLRLVVTSATLNTKVFQTYFGGCPLVEVQGRTFPVVRVYENSPVAEYIERVIEKTVEVCQSEEEGDILVFLTQQNEIEKTCEKLRKRLVGGSGAANVPKILPLHGKLQADEQEEVFKPTPKGERKIVVATNSAETSITIDGIRIVIDSGMVKEPSFDPQRNMITLDVKRVSRSSALQRSGRAGRTAPGKCYCLYTEKEFDAMDSDTKPEILKMHLGLAVLQLLSLGVTNVAEFDFVQAPHVETLVKAQESLELLGAIDAQGVLTDQGREMLELPMEPKLSKALLEGLRRGCGEKIVTSVALMSGGRDVFYRGDTVEKKNACAILKQEFCQSAGDLLSALDVYSQWSQQPSSKQNRWCMDNALNAKTLRATRETADEIKHILKKLKLCDLTVVSEDVETDIAKSFLAGYSENVAWSLGHEKLGYVVVASRQDARLHPSSVLSSLGSQPGWVLFQEMRRTSEVFLMTVTPLQFDWLAEVAMHVLQYIDEPEIERRQAKHKRLSPVGPALVKTIIGPKGAKIREIQQSVASKAREDPLLSDMPVQSRACLIECDVDRGVVDIYAPAKMLPYAKSLVETEMAQKRDDILNERTEVVISSIGKLNLKTLVGNDMKTRAIMQPGQVCQLDVFIKRMDETCDIDPEEVLTAILEEVGSVVHTRIIPKQFLRQNHGYYKWGSVTFNKPRELNNVPRVIMNTPSNVEEISLKPSRFEHTLPQDSNKVVSGIRVSVLWFPYSSAGIAYVRCTDDSAPDFIHCVNATLPDSPARQNKKGGDVVLKIDRDDDNTTVFEKIKLCGFPEENISKVTVPPMRPPFSPSKEDLEREMKEDLTEFLQCKFDGKAHMVNHPWGNCYQARARVAFMDLDDAREAIEEYNCKVDVLGARRVYLQFEESSDIVCNTPLYNKVKKIIGEMVEKHDGVKLQVEQQRDKGTKLTIKGKNGEDVQILVQQITEVVSILRIPVEEPAVARTLTSGNGRSRLKKIEKDCGAFVQSYMMGRCVQITGSLSAKEKALKAIEKFINELEKTKSFEISLRAGADVPVGAIRRLLQEYGRDLARLVEGHDECTAILDIHRRRLILSGDVEGLQEVRKKAESFLESLRSDTASGDNGVNEETCPVCTADVEQPHRLSICGHPYCQPCVEHYVTTTLESTRREDTFPQQCLHDGCEQPLTKDDYTAFLKQDQISLMYRVSFDCFLIGNDQYKPCPSPDCSSIYETTPRPAVFICPECSTRLCRGCGDEVHALFGSCEAFKDSKDPLKADQLYEEWAAKTDTRKCPKCEMMIEKDGGCMHMECIRCGAHMCWRCGTCFSTGREVYAHQSQCKVPVRRR